jgi:hypothetical protein
MPPRGIPYAKRIHDRLPVPLGAEGEESLAGRSGFQGPPDHDRKPLPAEYVKSRPVKDQEVRRQWAAGHDCCQVCRIDEHKARWVYITGLQTHHIIKAGRSHEACNLLRVCEQRHQVIKVVFKRCRVLDFSCFILLMVCRLKTCVNIPLPDCWPEIGPNWQ